MMEAERARLLREDPWDVQSLAQELYAMFSDDIDPLDVGSGISARYRDRAPFIVNNFPDTGDMPLLEFKRPNGTTFTISINQSGGIVTNDDTTTNITQSGSSGFPGKVVSGTGATYQVDVYTHGLDEDPITVEVTQLSIDSAATIAAGTWATVFKQNATYFMQVPVWG